MEKFKIYIDRLKDGHTEEIDITVLPTFIEVKEEALSFPNEVSISGQAYLTDEHLITNLNIETSALLSCSICNNPVQILVTIHNHSLAEPLEEICSPIYDLTNEIREAILLEIPQFVECNKGNCPERVIIKKYLSDPSQTNSSNPSHFPFADLDNKF
jgi:uncharacterized metal-binding protein YceD (DUF177 family)